MKESEYCWDSLYGCIGGGTPKLFEGGKFNAVIGGGIGKFKVFKGGGGGRFNALIGGGGGRFRALSDGGGGKFKVLKRGAGGKFKLLILGSLLSWFPTFCDEGDDNGWLLFKLIVSISFF